jgi:hypothetical protein
MSTSSPASSVIQAGETALLEQAGDFVLSMLQAFLRTGYYMPDHPETLKSKSGLYDKFVKLVQAQGEISFLTGEDQGHRIMLVEGIVEKPLRLSEMLQRGIAETYTPHFIKFFERKEIICLSLTSRMGAEEFSQFIDVMSEPSYSSMEGRSAKEQFVRTLRARNICNISFVFSEEFITVRANVPWRTRMALSRLKKDIHLLPILRNLEESELQQIKLNILADILRPLGVADLVYAFLINLDLASSNLLSEEDAEERVFSLINDRLIVRVGDLFIRDSLASDGGFPEHVTPQKKGRILAGICQRLNISKDQQAGTILETLFEKGLISLDELPFSVKNRVLTIKRVTTFLMKPDRFLEALDKTTESDIYEFRVQSTISFVPVLVERGNFHEAIAIIELINKHISEKSERSLSAIKKREDLIVGGTLELASQSFLVSTKETRTLIGKFLQLIGHEAIPHLLHILQESDDPWRSKQATEILVAMGDKAVESLIASIEENLLTLDSLPVVLRIVSEMPHDALRDRAIQVMLKYIDNPIVEIRREALFGLCRLNPSGFFTVFRAGLSDTDLRVRKIAAGALGKAGDRRGFELLKLLAENANKTGRPEDQELAAVAVEALGSLMNSCPASHDTILSYLASLVEQYSARRGWKDLVSGSPRPPDTLLLTLTETLGKQQGKGVTEQLTRLSKHQNPEVARRAAELSGKNRL